MSEFLRTPERRTCERCGRLERYDEDASVWRAERTGDVHCIHEWDIDGAFVPVKNDVPSVAEEC